LRGAPPDAGDIRLKKAPPMRGFFFGCCTIASIVLSGTQEVCMIAVIFEVWPAEGRANEYFDLAAGLRAELERMDGFISIERFESLTSPGKYLSLSIWRDEEALQRWRNIEDHRRAQAKGRGGVFRDYRLRVASVLRDYGMRERAQAPADSLKRHG
jgi:heme-degrading monooxygenase HmoA